MKKDQWDWIEGLRSTSIEEALAHEAARVLADEVLAWPPEVAWDDARVQAELAPLFQLGAEKPSLAAIGLGFRLARWDLERQLEAIDHAMRNDLLGRELHVEQDRLAARFLWRWLPEWLLELKDRAGPRITRAHLILALDQAEARVRGHGGPRLQP